MRLLIASVICSKKSDKQTQLMLMSISSKAFLGLLVSHARFRARVRGVLNPLVVFRSDLAPHQGAFWWSIRVKRRE